MSEKMLESLSAAIDNEAGAFELRRLLDEAGRSGELREAWVRYHAFGAVLRGEWQPGDAELGVRVGRASQPGAQRDADGDSRPAASKPWRERALAASLAVAVTVVVLFAMNPAPDSAGGPNGQAAVRPLQDAFGRQALPGPVGPTDTERLNAYMMRHVQHRAMHHPGVLSFTKYITYEAADSP